MGKDDAKYVESDAVVSECGKYRYLLRRVWDHARPRALLVMLNPSTADALKDDATIRSCVRLLNALHYGSMEVVNAFAFRATDPKDLPSDGSAIGPQNEGIVDAALYRCDVVVCAWGAHGPAQQRLSFFRQFLKSRKPAVYCFGRTKAGHPKHPLYLKTGTTLEVFL